MPEIIDHIPSQQELESRPKAIVLRDGAVVEFEPKPIEGVDGRYRDIKNTVAAEIITGSINERVVVFHDTPEKDSTSQRFLVMDAKRQHDGMYMASKVLGIISRESPHFFIGYKDMIERGAMSVPDAMSERQAIIALKQDGLMQIIDLDSFNGTEVFVGDEAPVVKNKKTT